ELRAVRIPPEVGAALELARHVFALDHLAETGHAVRAPDPALLDPAPGRGRLAVAVDAVVDGHDPRLQLPLQAARRLRIARPSAGREAVIAVVGQPDGFVDGRHGHDGQDGPERLLTHDPHRVVHAGEDGRRVEVTGPRRGG